MTDFVAVGSVTNCKLIPEYLGYRTLDQNSNYVPRSELRPEDFPFPTLTVSS